MPKYRVTLAFLTRHECVVDVEAKDEDAFYGNLDNIIFNAYESGSFNPDDNYDGHVDPVVELVKE